MDRSAAAPGAQLVCKGALLSSRCVGPGRGCGSTSGDGALRIPSVVAYLILLGLLFGLWRFTSIGLDHVPDRLGCREAACSGEASAALARAQRSPRHLLVPVTLEGMPLVFLLDTGASTTVLARAAAESLGLLDDSRAVLGAVNETFGVQHVLSVRELVVAGHAFGGFDVTIIDMAGIRSALGPGVAGVLGAEVLASQSFEIDFAGPTLLLGRNAEAFAASRRPGESDTNVAVRDLGGGFFVEALADDLQAWFLVDSGANTSQIGPVLASRLGGVRAGQGRAYDATGGEDRVIASARLSLLAVGDLARRDVVVTVGEPSLLGADFFTGTVLRIDPAAGLLTVRTRSIASTARRPSSAAASGS